LYLQLRGRTNGEDEASGYQSTIPSRRQAISSAALATMATMNAEMAWRYAVHDAAASAATKPLLPPGAIDTLESGKAVILPNWLSSLEVAALRDDIRNCFEGGHFEKFAYSRRLQGAPKKGDIDTNPYMMKSFSPSTKKNGPFVDSTVGNFELRQQIKYKMAQVKAQLASSEMGITRRPTLSDDIAQTHEMEYLRYGPGGSLERHVDERHVELKRPNGSRLSKKADATRRSITWLVYLNDDDWEKADGGELRLHERAQSIPPTCNVGSIGPDLQIGWLKATSSNMEQPVFLDPFQSSSGDDENTCMLYIVDDNKKRVNLSSKPFPNMALHVAGGDAMARTVMVENPEFAKRLHLIDAPKSAIEYLVASKSNKGENDTGEDGGEKVRDILPAAGTLVMFDSVSLPHEVLETRKERYAVQGWFHEKLYY